MVGECRSIRYMKKPEVLENELARLQTLLEYEILDTAPEIEYDDITDMASMICDTPIALISLSDENRQWFKSRRGLDANEIPRDISFCGHVIQGQKVMNVPDSLKDERFFDNPFVLGPPYARFYAGAPILAPNGLATGTVCVIDRQPRQLSEKQLNSLEALARLVAGQLETRKANAAIRRQLQELQDCSKKISRQEEALVHSAKMTSLGEMASGLAHEINNPLAIIMGYNQIILDLSEKNTLAPEKALELSHRIEKTGSRIAKIIASLRAFARDGRNDPYANASVLEIVNQALDFCRSRFKSHKILLDVREIPAELSFECQRVQVSQMLLNLLNNSFDAVDGKTEKWVRVEVLNHDNEISFVVTDSGKGIPEGIRANIMHPFFTTKMVGKGAGLGLSVANGILQAHSGNLRLDTANRNTCFVATFPKTQKHKRSAA